MTTATAGAASHFDSRSSSRSGSPYTRRLSLLSGLSIVAAVAEAHGHSVDARSEAGRGTTFLIVLPLSPQQGERRVADPVEVAIQSHGFHVSSLPTKGGR